METWTLSGMGCYLSRHLRQSAIRESSVQAGSTALKRNSTNRRSILTLSLVLTSFLLPSRPRRFGAYKPWSWYPTSVNVWHQRRMSHVLQPFFANVSRWLLCVETSNAFWGYSSHPIVVMFSNNDCNNLIYWNNNYNIIATHASELYRTMLSVGFVFIFSVLCYNNNNNNS